MSKAVRGSAKEGERERAQFNDDIIPHLVSQYLLHINLHLMTLLLLLLARLPCAAGTRFARPTAHLSVCPPDDIG